MSNELWMVRSSGRIVGPFNQEEVGQRIATREFSPLDEAALPKRKWKSIREIPEFKPFVDNPGKTYSDDGTDTGTANLDEMTQSVTYNMSDADLTDKISMTDAGNEIVYDDVEEEVITSKAQRVSQTVKQKGPVYGMEGSQQAMQSAKEATKPLWYVVAAIIVAISGFLVYSSFIKRPMEQARLAKSNLEDGQIYLEQGRYKKALEKFEMVYKADPTNREHYIYYATLKLQVDGDTMLSKQLYHEILNDQNPVIAKLANTGLGLAHLWDNELDQAEFHFRESLNFDGMYEPALLNIGTKNVLAGSWSNALESFSRAYQMKPQEPHVLFNLIRGYVEVAKIQQNRDYTDKALQVITELKKNKNIFYQEAILLEIYLMLQTNQKTEVEAKIIEFLDSNPFLTEEYRYNLFVNRQFVSWKSLSSYCSEIIANMDESYFSKSFEAFCQAKAEQFSIAKKVIEDAVARAPRNALVQSIYSYILMKMGLKIEASVALGSANKNNSDNEYSLPNVMQAKFCASNKDWECAGAEWNKVLEKNVNDISALTGLAQVSYESHDKQGAFRYLNKAKSITEDYIPLKVLETRMKE